MSTSGKYTGAAADWTRTQYADAETYLRRRAELIADGLDTGDTVLDLACGDGGLGDFLQTLGLRYRGLDLNEAMVAEARRHGIDAVHGDLNDYVPPQPVAATTVFRAIYYARERRAFFRHAASYTERKLVFDLNPRQYELDDVLRDLRDCGFPHVVARPFFVPQSVALPAPAAAVARAAERMAPLARAVLRRRFTYVVTGSRSAPS